jgi:peptidoglycan-associated lipoprotein
MNGITMRRMAITMLAAGAMVLSGCHKKSNAPLPSALPGSGVVGDTVPTATLTADPQVIDLGQGVVLNWRTTGASSVTIDGLGSVNLNGTQTVTPSTSTNFHLVAKSDSGATTETSVRVTVRVPTAPSVPTANNDMGSDAEFHANVQDVYFDYDSYDLRTDGTTAAQHAASYMVSHPSIKIVIGGYCDERGSAEYNLALGENRANAAKTALVSAGVASSRVRAVSYGKEKQFCTEQNEACYQQNRRAQFSLDR